jgi:hypothetical protein
VAGDRSEPRQPTRGLSPRRPPTKSRTSIAALGVPGDQATSAELSIDFSTGSQASAWQIGLGVPSATQADVFEHGALVRIDAITGEATIIKS